MTTVAPWCAYSIVRASRAEYDALAPFHYRAGTPALPALFLACFQRREPAGVLVVSMPVLNGPWRARLWPDAFAGLDRRAGAAMVNRELRTISRVIVDPRFRATGVARRLVRAYLGAPLTRYTEAVAAIGAWCPFFARAGMSAVPVPPARRDRRLARELGRLHVPAWTLIELGNAARQLRRAPVAHAVRRWAADSRATRHLLDGPIAELGAMAAASLLSRPTAYGHDARAAR